MTAVANPESSSQAGDIPFMDQFVPHDLSPYRLYRREDWALLAEDMPLPLTEQEVTRLRSLNDRVSLQEVNDIYLPLSRLLSLYVTSAQTLFTSTRSFLASDARKMPFIIGVAGSVAVGKSTTARLLQALLMRWSRTPKVDLITTDGFLYPNAVLEAEGIMDKKGFPESYDTAALLKFLTDVKGGKRHVEAPLYSHLVYDVLPNETVVIDQPDILIVEGLNVFQPARMPKDGKAIPFVSDFFDFSVYVDTEPDVARDWYIKRFMRLRETAFKDPDSYFHRYSKISEAEALEKAKGLWDNINLPNLLDNILPTRQRADLILHKTEKHMIDAVALRKL